MALFIVIVIILVILFNGRNFSATKDGRPTFKKGSIRKPPHDIHIISPSPDSFDLSIYNQPLGPLPDTKGGLFNINKDRKLLEQYAAELDEHLQNVDAVAYKAINRFEFDHVQLLDQQLQIYRRIYLYRKIISRFKELKSNRLHKRDLSNVYRVAIPPRPSYPTIRDLERKYSIPERAGTAIGRGISSSGLNGSQKAGAFAIALLAMIIKGAADNSKIKRVLETSRGNVLGYCTTLKNTVEILDKYHQNIIDTSKKLKKSESELIALINTINSIDPKITKLGQLQPELMNQVWDFQMLLLEAERYGKNKLVYHV